MQYQTHELDSLVKQAFGNEQRIRLAHRAGCYHCAKIFPTSEIVDWCDDKPHRTAVCPHCLMDSVIAEPPDFALTPELMQQMRARYFASDVLLESIDLDSFGSIEEIRAELVRLGFKIKVV